MSSLPPAGRDLRRSRRPGGAFWTTLGVALLVRILLLPIPNTDNDIVFQTWSRMVTVEGFHKIYDVYDPTGVPPRECQYPPGYLYVLWAVGNVYRSVFSPTFDPRAITLLILLRIPTVVADLALAVLLFFVIGRAAGRRAAHIAFAAYALASALILDSTIVTQIDSVQVLLMTSTVVLLAWRRGSLAIACLALAALTKPQSAVLGPLVVFTVWRRDGFRALVKGASGACGVFVLLSLPFLLQGKTFELFRMLTSFVGVAPYRSLNAYNFWWIFSGGAGWQPDTGGTLGFLTHRQLGLAMLAGALILGLYRVHRDASRESILLAALWTSFAFFMLPTEMTERYLLPVLPLALLLGASGASRIGTTARSCRLLYGVLLVTSFLNLYFVFPIVAISPWDALQLPHSNFHWYLAPQNGPPLAVLAPWAEPGEYRPGHEFQPWKAVSLVIASVHALLFAWLAVRVWPKGGRQSTV
jgi:Gpi18-like mannosyltransferase